MQYIKMTHEKGVLYAIVNRTVEPENAAAIDLVLEGLIQINCQKSVERLADISVIRVGYMQWKERVILSKANFLTEAFPTAISQWIELHEANKGKDAYQIPDREIHSRKALKTLLNEPTFNFMPQLLGL